MSQKNGAQSDFKIAPEMGKEMSENIREIKENLSIYESELPIS